MLSGACHVMATAALAMTSFAIAAGIYGCQWAQRFYGTGRVDLVEIFGGHSEVNMEASRQGWLATQPYD